MAKRAAETANERDMRAILQAIAAPPEAQNAVFGDICVPHALMGRFEHVSGKILRARARKPTPEARAALGGLAERFRRVGDDPAHECYSEAYVRASPLWRDVREAAARALDAFGWPPGTPLRSTVVVEEPGPIARDVPNSRRGRPHGSGPWSDADTTLAHHRALFAMLDVAPVVSGPFAAILAEREQALGVRFPASVVEFLRLRGAFGLFESNSDEDSLIGGVYNADDRTRLRALGTPRDVGHGHLRVAISREGFLTWYVRLDGSDDPPVDFVHSEEDCEDDEAGEPILTWRPFAASFSAFVFDRMTRRRFRAPDHELTMEAVAAAPTDTDRRRLGAALQIGPHHQANGDFADRYFTPHGLVRVSSEDWQNRLGPGQAVWEVQADSVDTLAGFFRTLAPIGTLARDLELTAHPAGLAAAAEAALAPIRAG